MSVWNQPLFMPVIAAVVYMAMDIIKEILGKRERLKRFIPIIAGGMGAVCGLLAYLFYPGISEMPDAFTALVSGAVSGLSATGTNQIVRQLTKAKRSAVSMAEKEDVSNNRSASN